MSFHSLFRQVCETGRWTTYGGDDKSVVGEREGVEGGVRWDVEDLVDFVSILSDACAVHGDQTEFCVFEGRDLVMRTGFVAEEGWGGEGGG